ncbi:helix-turn-helix transcriptional regulator [Pseudomonas sp. BIC9C]|uniref:helix-turn-helix transcriptional regulator n=1 Tax=Pseudomonas sp. BIC9C TaxID=3078458 RepID=UPI002AD3E68F|nr:AlpA family phage regulatory protein [Pseudomonas sp. BIC9C]
MQLIIHRRPAVSARIGFGKTHLYELIGQGEFPAPIALSKRAVGWLSSDVDAWIEARAKGRAWSDVLADREARQ